MWWFSVFGFVSSLIAENESKEQFFTPEGASILDGAEEEDLN